MSTQLNTNVTAGKIIATETLAGEEIEVVKVAYGATGDLTKVSAADPLPVTGTVTVDTSTLATSAKQDTGNTSLGSIDTKLSSQATAANQATEISALASILAKLSADPATQTTLAAVLAKLTSDPATQTTLAAILAKIIAAPATEAKQDTGNTSLASIDGKLTNPLPVSGTVATGGLTDTQLRATPVPVSMSSDIQIGAVEIKNGSDDTRATVTASNALKTDGSAVTQPVSAASLPLPALAATSTKQSDGTQKSQVVDGSGNVIGATSNALDINIKSGNPTTITATQATGTNLHTVVDSGTITTVSTVTAVTAISNALPAGNNNIGDVDIASALPAGTNAIGKLAANTGVTIGAVEIAAAQTLAAVTAITNNVNTVEVVGTTIYNGKKTVTTAGTRVTLAASQAVKSVTIKALKANTGIIYVGDGSVASTTGFQLYAGESVSMDIANLTTVNLDSSVNGEGVTYLGVN